MHLQIARVGNGVTDLGLVRPFYEALGFTATPPYDLGTKIADQSETPDVPLVIQIARNHWLALELCQAGAARPAGPPVRRPLNLLGLTHLALVVEDVNTAVTWVRANGGRDFPFGWSRSGDGELGVDGAMCVDPCGLRLLLLASAGGVLGGDQLGVCVADVEESLAFYVALGFEAGAVVEAGVAFSRLAELHGVPLRLASVTKDGYRLLLQEWGGRRDPGVPVRLPLNGSGSSSTSGPTSTTSRRRSMSCAPPVGRSWTHPRRVARPQGWRRRGWTGRTAGCSCSIRTACR